jgi:hypothetical protein
MTCSLEEYADKPHNELIKAVLKNNIENVKKLINSKKYDINAKNYSGDGTALLEACFDGTKEMVKLLIDNGADCTIKNGGGLSCFDLAKKYNQDVYEYLMSKSNL